MCLLRLIPPAVAHASTHTVPSAILVSTALSTLLVSYMFPSYLRLLLTYDSATFVPSLLAGLGFTSTTDAQLLTVPVYAVGALAFIFCGRMSDKTKLRGPFIAGSLFFGVIGYIMLAVAPQVGVRYAAVFIAAIALYTSTSLNVL